MREAERRKAGGQTRLGNFDMITELRHCTGAWSGFTELWQSTEAWSRTTEAGDLAALRRNGEGACVVTVRHAGIGIFRQARPREAR